MSHPPQGGCAEDQERSGRLSLSGARHLSVACSSKPGVACATRPAPRAAFRLHPAYSTRLSPDRRQESRPFPREERVREASSGSRVQTACSSRVRGHPRVDSHRLFRTFELESAALAATVSSTAPPRRIGEAWRTGSLSGARCGGRLFTARGPRLQGPPLSGRMQGRRALFHGRWAAPRVASSRRRYYEDAGRGREDRVCSDSPLGLPLRLLLLAVAGLQPPWNDASCDASPRLPAGG